MSKIEIFILTMLTALALFLPRVVIHELGHYICIRICAKRLRISYKPTQVNIGIPTALPLTRTKKFRFFALRRKGCWVFRGYIRTPFNHALANYDGVKCSTIIKIYALSGKALNILIYLLSGNAISLLSYNFIDKLLGETVFIASLLLIVFEIWLFLRDKSDTSDIMRFKYPEKFTRHFKSFRDDDYHL